MPHSHSSNGGHHLFSRARTFRSARGARLSFSEWNAPRPGITPTNAPPRFFHLNVHGGDLGKAFAFDWPSHEVEPPDPIPKKRKEAFLLGQQTWAGRSGTLVLAPSFPAGGIDGDHVIFRWTEENREYAISIHAWLPLQDTLTTLEEVVESVES